MGLPNSRPNYFAHFEFWCFIKAPKNKHINSFHKVKNTQHQTLTLVPNQVRLKQNLQKYILAFNRGVKLRNAPFFCDKLNFIQFYPPFFFS
jgi:hypothetical protein